MSSTSPNAASPASSRLERAGSLRALVGWSLGALTLVASVASWYLISPWPARSTTPIALSDLTLVVAGAAWLAVAVLLCTWLVVRARASVQDLREAVLRLAPLEQATSVPIEAEPALPSSDVRARLVEEERDLARLGAWRQAVGILFPLGIVAALFAGHFPRLPL